jgi:hypothetical protein
MAGLEVSQPATNTIELCDDVTRLISWSPNHAQHQFVVRHSEMPNVRDQRRRALGAPLADRNLSAPVPVPASGVPTRDDRCIA